MKKIIFLKVLIFLLVLTLFSFKGCGTEKDYQTVEVFYDAPGGPTMHLGGKREIGYFQQEKAYSPNGVIYFTISSLDKSYAYQIDFINRDETNGDKTSVKSFTGKQLFEQSHYDGEETDDDTDTSVKYLFVNEGIIAGSDEINVFYY